MDTVDLSFLSGADVEALLLVNGTHSPALDTLMWWVSDKWIWLPLYLFLAVAVVRRVGVRRGAAALVTVAMLILFTDQMCASVIRPAVARLRPSAPGSPLSPLLHLVNGYRGGTCGFPSCHAANTAALALFIGLLFRSRRAVLVMMTWSALIGYSRIYLGVHYPSDVLAGMLLGSLAALIFYALYRFLIFSFT